METAAFIASVVSVILAIFAIWLSIVFYKMSKESTEKAKDAAQNIASSVVKLELIFNKMYTDTFGIVRDTFSDLRKQSFQESNSIDDSNAEQKKEVDEKLSTLNNEALVEIMDKIKGIENKNDVNMKVIRNELNKVVRNTIDDAREIEKEVSLRQAILDAIWKTLKYTGFSSARDIIGVLESIHRYYRRGILSELFAMYDEGKLVSTTKLRDRHDIQLTTMFSIAPREQVSIQE